MFRRKYIKNLNTKLYRFIFSGINAPFFYFLDVQYSYMDQIGIYIFYFTYFYNNDSWNNIQFNNYTEESHKD